MEHPTRLVHLLTNLSSQQDPSEPTLNESLDSLDCALAAAVESYAGLQLMLRRDGYPVVLTVHRTAGRPPDPDDVPFAVTSCRVPLSLVDANLEPGSQVVVYATTPGALVDLAADLSYALADHSGEVSTGLRPGRPDSLDDSDHAPTVGLDLDLPPPALPNGLTGLEELSTINRATGVLIESGHDPDRVHAVLHRQAAAAGLRPHVYAARLLQAQRSEPPREPKPGYAGGAAYAVSLGPENAAPDAAPPRRTRAHR